jgi:5-methylcytosine-specific restriction endonuclease McrA
MLRLLWLHSRERREALKRDTNTCVKCGKKAYKKTKNKKVIEELKVIVHHKKGIHSWEKIIDLIYRDVLCELDKLETLCTDCHDKEHK